MAIQMPIPWIYERLKGSAQAVGSETPEEYWHAAAPDTEPVVRRISGADLRIALDRGAEDFQANRTDVVFLCLLYPAVGLMITRLAFGYDVLPMVFPLASGFALVGPLAAVGLNEMSRRREKGLETSWLDAFSVLRSPSIGSIALLGFLLVGLYLVWVVAAGLIYAATLGPEPPASIAAFVRSVFTTGAGWAMIVVGCGVGFVFAVVVLAISAISFPLLLDRPVGFSTAMATSLRAMMVNPVPMLAWGVIVTAGLVIGSVPAMVGLIIVLPILGHATWHLYRRIVS